MKIKTDLDILEEDSVYTPDDDSYLLISLMEIEAGERVLEIGCGSGIISIHCALAGGVVTAVDINEKAVKQTKYNAEKNGVVIHNILVGDMFQPVKGIWDVIVFNPPYLPKIDGQKTDVRWDGGSKGDETTVRFLEEAWKHMHTDSRLYFCCSDMAPMDEIERIINQYYVGHKEETKNYDFENLYAFGLVQQ